MSAFLDEVAEILETAGVGVWASNTGRNIFVGQLPPSPDNCTALLGLPGPNIGVQRDVSALNFPRFQALVRNTDYTLGDAKLRDVRNALHGLLGARLTDWYILRCHADQEGGPIGQDEEGRYEFSINFTAEMYSNLGEDSGA